MSLQPSDKKALLSITGVAAVVVVVIAVATTFLVRGHDAPPPALSLATGEKLVRAEPTFWCDAKMTDCEPFDPRKLDGEVPFKVASAPVAVGDTLILSVPGEVAEGPWVLVAEYATPKGLVRQQWIHRSGTMYTQKLPSTPDRVLLGIEVTPLSAVVLNAPGGLESGDGEILGRGIYSARTAPPGFQPKNTAELPAER